MQIQNQNQIFLSDFIAGGVVPPGDNVRITEESEVRITEDGAERIIE